MGRNQVKCHGDDTRFEILAEYIYDNFGSSVKYIADVAGGQGNLSRILNKRYNYEAEVIDPRHYVIKGVSHRECEYTPDMADYYDLIVGLHPDQATRPVAESAFSRPVVIVPCCNFWDSSRKLGSKSIAEEIFSYYNENHIACKMEQLKFSYPNFVVVAKGKKK